jgi:hypothetical protein
VLAGSYLRGYVDGIEEIGSTIVTPDLDKLAATSKVVNEAIINLKCPSSCFVRSLLFRRR